jgi:hypothetical protein
MVDTLWGWMHSFSWWGDLAKILAAVAAIASLIYGYYQPDKRQSESRERQNHDNILLGFLHGLKPSIQSARRGENVSPMFWRDTLDQIHDMMERLQPPKSSK